MNKEYFGYTNLFILLYFLEYVKSIKSRADARSFGWAGRDRTCEWRDQNPLPYHLATAQYVAILS